MTKSLTNFLFKLFIFSFFPLFLAVILTGCNSVADNIEQQIDELYNKMSQPERIAQLRSMYMDDLFDEQGQLDTAKCRELIPNGIGHFSQFCLQQPRTPDELRNRAAAIQDWLMHHTPNGIPALLHEEVLSGVNTLGATIYPQQIGQACSFNTELAELKTRQTSTLMRKLGGVLALSPMVDVCRTPSFNRLEESYGEDGYLSAAMGVAFVKGLQQGDLRKGVGACSKHYLGYGGGGDADEKELMEEILFPHEAMIRLAGSKVVMPGYHEVHGTQCVANSEILQDILRDYVGFDGMVVSDYTAIDQLPGLATVAQKAAAAINAGNDVDFPHGANYMYLQEAIDQGLVAPEVLERAVKNVLRQKFRAGLFDKDAYLYSTEPIVLDTPEERQTAYDIATQSVVLLENNGVLPLSTFNSHLSTLNVLLTGPNANSIWAMCGDYSYPAMSYFWKRVEDVADRDNPHVVKLLEGMTHRKPEGVSLMYSRGCDWTEEIETDFKKNGDVRAWEYEILHRKVDSGEKADRQEALAMAAQADVIIAAVGENVMLCGENRDRQGLRLPGRQEQFVEELIATGKPVVLVMFGGRAQVVSGLAERCAAVIQAWYPGEEGGNAVADILYGKVSPSAKLSVSYPNTEVYEPLCYNNPSPLAVHPSLKAAGPILATPNTQWPFGYGLSYTTFSYSNLQIAKEASTSDESINLSFEVENTGKVAADEIAQIYISSTKDDQPIRHIQLQGFARIPLQPGERKTVRVKLYVEQFGYYSNTGQRQWNIAPGTYTVKVGASSADIKLSENVTLKGAPVSKPLREFYFSETTVK
jgi:beta-glucosidase